MWPGQVSRGPSCSEGGRNRWGKNRMGLWISFMYDSHCTIFWWQVGDRGIVCQATTWCRNLVQHSVASGPGTGWIIHSSNTSSWQCYLPCLESLNTSIDYLSRLCSNYCEVSGLFESDNARNHRVYVVQSRVDECLSPFDQIQIKGLLSPQIWTLLRVCGMSWRVCGMSWRV